MNFQGHAICAGLAGSGAAGFFYFQGLPATAALGVGGLLWLGGQFPDLDVGSIPGRWFGRLGFLAAAFLTSWGLTNNSPAPLVWSSLIGLTALFIQGMKHRGPMHKYYLPLILLLLAVFGVFEDELFSLLIGAFAGGICIHLFLDGIFPWSFKGWFF